MHFSTAYRPDIDGLRALAVVAVVGFHASPFTVPGGFAGVDIFLVISGYLISGIVFKRLREGSFSFAEFYARRINRIFPALGLVLAASALFGWFALLPDEYEQLGKHIAASTAFISNFVFWREAGYFDTSAELKPLLHIWSLGIEEQFYLVWPLLVFIAWKFRAAVGSMIALAIAVSFALSAWGVQSDPVPTFYLLHARFWELSLGSLLAYAESGGNGPQIRSVRARDAASWAGLLLLVFTLAALNNEKPFPGWWALPPTLGAALLIGAGKDAWVNRKLLANRALVIVGLISYPLYLWHWPLLSFARIIESEAPSRTLRLSAVCASFALAWLTYRYLELPIRRPSGGMKMVARNALVLLCLMCGVGIAGLWIVGHEGIEARVAEFAQINRQFKYRAADNQQLCRARFPFAPENYCVGFVPDSPARPRILVVGDSHSEGLSRGLVSEAGSLFPGYEVLGIGKGGCLPFLEVETLGRSVAGNCPPVMGEILKYAIESDDVKAVVLNARYAVRVSGAGFGKIDAEVYSHIQAPGPRIENADYAQVFAAGLSRTLAALQKAGKTVYFVHQVPELGFDPRSCEGIRPLQFLQKARSLCAVPREKVEARQKAYRSIVSSVLRGFPSVRVFDPLPYLCDERFCYAMRDGKMLYRDSDHISIDGSILLAHHFDPR